MHRIGGIEKEDGTGNISYEPENHERMVRLREAKIAGIAADIPDAEVRGSEDADLLVVGWGSTWAAIDASVERLRRRGQKVAWVHLVHLNPLPSNLGDILRRYRHVVVPEMNLGQLCQVIRGKYLVDATAITKVQGAPFTALELEDAYAAVLDGRPTTQGATTEGTPR
jgi:2-oxoglutarate ferredoxin oxidoreductase subunit alpha